MPVQPVQWAPEQRAKFLDWISTEIPQALGARQALEAKWRTWLEMYRAPAIQPKKRFPFDGASNVKLPVIATDVDQLYAKFMQTIHATDTVWTLSPLNESWVQAAKPMQDFLQLIDQRLLRMWDVDKRAVMEMVKLGTAIYKTYWHYEDRQVQNFSGDRPSKVRRIRSRPVVDHVSLNDFLLPPSATAINPDEQGGADWVGERLRVRPGKLLAMAQSTAPVLPNMKPADVELVIASAMQFPTEYAQKIQQLDYFKGSTVNSSSSDFDKSDASTARGVGMARVNEVELWELHVRAETRKNEWNDIIVWFHLPTRTMLRDVIADYPFMGRPYDKIVYFPGEGFYGIGVCEQEEMFQNSMSDVFNFQMDNMLLGNSVGLVAKAGSNIGPGEPIYPGMVKIVDGDVNTDFKSFKLGDINPGIPQTFGLIQGLARLRSGVSDLQLGSIDALPSRTPATTTLSLLQEGNRRPDLTIKDLRYSGLGAVGMKVLQLLQQHISRKEIGDEAAGTYLVFAVEALGLPEGSEVAKKLIMPMEDVELGLACQLTATNQGTNKDLQRQSYQTLMQTAMGVANTILGWQQLAMQAPPLVPTIQQATNGILELFNRYLEQFDVRNPEAIVPPAQQNPTQVPAPLGPGAVPGAGPPAAGAAGGLSPLGNGAGAPVGAGM